MKSTTKWRLLYFSIVAGVVELFFWLLAAEIAVGKGHSVLKEWLTGHAIMGTAFVFMGAVVALFCLGSKIYCRAFPKEE